MMAYANVIRYFVSYLIAQNFNTINFMWLVPGQANDPYGLSLKFSGILKFIISVNIYSISRYNDILYYT